MTIHQRPISTALQTHLDGTGTTLCFLIKITTRDGTVFGITTLDQDIVYDDGSGTGDVTYSAAIGADQSALETTSDLEVDNSEATVLLSDTVPFSEEAINNGALDYGQFVIYRVNWQDLSQGHIVVQVGTTGAVKARDGITGIIELRGLPQGLKQNFVELYSITCRAKFGGGSYPDDRFPCGFDATTLWQNHSVDTVNIDEPDRVFAADSAPTVAGPGGALPFVPGLIEWLTGNNAGITSETETVDGVNIDIRFSTPYDIEIGDTFKIRPDCDKTWTTCKDLYQNQANFRGEPFIPLADEGRNQTPGAAVGEAGWYKIFEAAGVVKEEP